MTDHDGAPSDSHERRDIVTGVRLRSLRLDDVGWLSAMQADPVAVGPHNWGGTPRDIEQMDAELRRRIEAGPSADPLAGQLVVELTDGPPIGEVSWRSERWGPSPKSVCPAFGIALLPEFRGQGLGTEAQRLLVGHLFATTDCNRVQSDTAADNPVEQRALEKVGLLREGVVRGAEHRDGVYHDHVVYGILRAEWTTPTAVG